VAVIEQFEQVRAVLGEPSPATWRKIQSRLNRRMIAFIERSPLVMLATVDDEGFPTVSPKGDAAGFVKVPDEGTLLLPERKGNKLAFSFRNLLTNDRAGLIFMVPGTPETLRVHGRCQVLHDAEMGRAMASDTQDALLIVEMQVTRCYFHCAKAFLRSGAWKPDSWGPRQTVSFGEEIHGTGSESRASAKALDEAVQARYQTDL